MELKLNIYKNNREVEKTYKTDTFDLMYGTLEDLICAIDPAMLKSGIANIDEMQLGSLVISLLPQIKPLLCEMFDGLTADEVRRTKVKELVPIFIEAFTYAFAELNPLAENSGN